MLDRRQFLALSAAAAAGLSIRSRASALQPEPASGAGPGYAEVVVIDGLGAPGGSSDGPLTAEQVAEIRASGLTAVNLTVSSVGVLSGAFEATVDGIAFWEQELA